MRPDYSKNNPLQNNFFYKNVSFFVFAALILLTIDAFPRAGGAGGGGGGGDSDSDFGAIIMLVYYIVELVMLLPFPWNIVVLGVIIVAGYFWLKNQKQDSTYNTLSKLDDVKVDSSSIASVVSLIPNFKHGEFYDKVNTAFLKIQTA